MVEWLTAKLGIQAANYALAGGAGLIIAYILKRIPNNVLKAKFGMFMYGFGVTVTLGLAKWKMTKRLWNKILEPWIVDALDNIVANGMKEFVRGLRSDNV